MKKMNKILFLILATLFSFSRMVHGDITWSSPVAISTALTDATDAHVVIDTDGNATAAWVENDIIKASSLPFGGSWDTPVTLSNVLNTSSSPKLGVDSAGNVTALWIEDTQIESATLPFGGSWSSSTTVSGAGATKPVLVVDADDNAVAVWVRSGFIESSTRVSGTWSLVAVLSGSSSDNPHVAINNNGKAIAVWHRVVSGADALLSSILTINTNTWATPINVLPGTAGLLHNYPKVAIDEGGNATIAWFRYNFLNGAFQNVEVLTSDLMSGAVAWSALPTFLSGRGLRNPADLIIKLRFDLNGDILAVWTNSYDGQTFTIESDRRIFGGSWPEIISIATPSIYSFSIDAAIASGTALVTNMAWDGMSAVMIQSQETDLNPVLQGYTSTVTFSSGDNNAYPQCDLSLNGSTFNAVAVWSHFDGSNIVIHAATGSSTAIEPPSDVLATQDVTNFGVFDDYYNTITWTASSDPDIIQYNIYRNGVFFASTDPSTLEFIDHNTIQGGTVTYGVAALTSNFRQSAIVSYTLFP